MVRCRCDQILMMGCSQPRILSPPPCFRSSRCLLWPVFFSVTVCVGICACASACACACVFRYFCLVFEQSSSGSASTRSTSPMGSRGASSQKTTHEGHRRRERRSRSGARAPFPVYDTISEPNRNEQQNPNLRRRNETRKESGGSKDRLRRNGAGRPRARRNSTVV